MESKRIWHFDPKSEITREEPTELKELSSNHFYVLDNVFIHFHPSLNVGQTHPSRFLRNLRQQLDHNAAHISSHCHPQSFLCRGAAENHTTTMTEKPFMEEQMRTRLKKKKSVIDNDCKEAGRQSPGWLNAHATTHTQIVTDFMRRLLFTLY